MTAAAGLAGFGVLTSTEARGAMVQGPWQGAADWMGRLYSGWRHGLRGVSLIRALQPAVQRCVL